NVHRVAPAACGLSALAQSRTVDRALSHSARASELDVRAERCRTFTHEPARTMRRRVAARDTRVVGFSALRTSMLAFRCARRSAATMTRTRRLALSFVAPLFALAIAALPVRANAATLLAGLGGPAGYGTNRMYLNDDGSTC